MRIRSLSLGPYSTNCYIVQEDTGCTIIDAPYPAERIIAELRENDILPSSVLLTHAHHDHVFGLEALRKAFPGIGIYAAGEDLPYLADDGKRLRAMLTSFDQSFLKTIHDIHLPQDIMTYDEYDGPFTIIPTPGHTPGSVSIYSGKDGVLFSGDTLFQGGVGRTDIGGDYSLLLQSLKKLAQLPENTVVLPGHGGVTDIGREKQDNIWMR